MKIYSLFLILQSIYHASAGLLDISIGYSNNIFIVYSDTKIYQLKLSTNTWIQYPGTNFARVASGSTGIIWAIDTSGKLYRYNIQTLNWDTNLTTCVCYDVAVGGDGSVAVIGCGFNGFGYGIYKWNQPTSGWTNIPGSVLKVDIGPDGQLWTINTHGTLWQSTTGMGNDWKSFTSQYDKIYDIFVDNYNRPYIFSNLKIFKYVQNNNWGAVNYGYSKFNKNVYIDQDISNFIQGMFSLKIAKEYCDIMKAYSGNNDITSNIKTLTNGCLLSVVSTGIPLIVIYRKNGLICYSSAENGRTLTISSSDKCRAPNPPLILAIYYTSDRTSTANSLLSASGTLNFNLNNNIIGGDPLVGTYKFVYILFQTASGMTFHSYGEGYQVILP